MFTISSVGSLDASQLSTQLLRHRLSLLTVWYWTQLTSCLYRPLTSRDNHTYETTPSTFLKHSRSTNQILWSSMQRKYRRRYMATDFLLVSQRCLGHSHMIGSENQCKIATIQLLIAMACIRSELRRAWYSRIIDMSTIPSTLSDPKAMQT
jgi:hypothetical protein